VTDDDKRCAIEALETIRAGLANPYDFAAPDYATAPAEPVAVRQGCYIFRLTPPLNSYTGLVLGEAIYPIADRADLARAISIVRGWRQVQEERRRKAERNSRKRR
jgi:hypothetical protein